MDDLFEHSIWTMYKRAYPTEEEKTRHDVPDLMHDVMMKGEGLKDGGVVQVENVETGKKRKDVKREVGRDYE
jgi:hypothetical protein